MSYQVRTEQTRVAVARRERDTALAQIDRKLRAKIRPLCSAGINDEAALIKVLAEDDEARKLMCERILRELWCERVIEDGSVPTIGESGQPICWRKPELVRN